MGSPDEAGFARVSSLIVRTVVDGNSAVDELVAADTLAVEIVGDVVSLLGVDTFGNGTFAVGLFAVDTIGVGTFAVGMLVLSKLDTDMFAVGSPVVVMAVEHFADRIVEGVADLDSDEGVHIDAVSWIPVPEKLRLVELKLMRFSYQVHLYPPRIAVP